MPREARKHQLLMMLDEFPALGRLDFFETSLAFMAGYGVRAFLIAQSLNQIEKAYGEHNSILDNCHVRVYAAPERVTDIALQPGETLTSVAAGDTVRWTVGDTTSGSAETRRTHILVKPFAAGLATNLIVTTDRRVYHVEMESRAGAAMAALSWTYPQDELIAIRRQQQAATAATPIASGLSVESLNFSYVISGDRPAWRPLSAFDDGRQTYIEFAPSIAVGEAPPLFVIGDDGEAQLVNYRVAGRYYVVDRLFGAAELRLGGKHQKIVRIERSPERRARRRAGRAS